MSEVKTYRLTPPARLDATVVLPASKSISNRSLVIHAITGSGPLPENLSDCDDTEVIIDALRHNPDVIDIKAAGTAMRFMTAYLSATPGEHVITGTERMRHRPIGILVDALRFLGADIEYTGAEGYPPLRIRGRQLDGGHIDVDGHVSSQYISALLLIGPVLRNGLELRLTGDIISRPYIDLTLGVMQAFGAEAEWSDVDIISVRPKPYRERPYLIENDWSAASYWYEMMALTEDPDASLRLEGLMDASMQGDAAARYLFSLLGVKTVFASRERGVPTTVTIRKSSTHVPRLDYDFVNAPDLAQTFVVCCCMKEIPFRFTGLSTLKIKETDRIAALKNEMRKLGFVLRDEENGSILIWDGERCEASSEPIDTYEDHRMALAMAPACIRRPGLAVRRPEVVSKSYPHFWEDLVRAGYKVEET